MLGSLARLLVGHSLELLQLVVDPGRNLDPHIKDFSKHRTHCASLIGRHIQQGLRHFKLPGRHHAELAFPDHAVTPDKTRLDEAERSVIGVREI